MGKSNRVEETNDSSTVSKLSMVRSNYICHAGWRKLEWFVEWERRTALINRGYYIRVEAIQSVLEAFLNAHSNEAVQIINLGAGFDTLLLRLFTRDAVADSCMAMDRLSNCRFIEVDLEKVIRRKAEIIRSRVGSSANDCEMIKNQNSCHQKDLERIFDNYTLVVCDLRDVEALRCKLLNDCALDPNRPTLIIAECVLNYLPANSADTLLSTLASVFSVSSFVVYEQVEPIDKFGQTMLKHFESIGSPLLSIGTYPSITNQYHRYIKLGFPVVECYPIGHLYQNYLTVEQRQRISALEPFDEYEMWRAKCAHYVVTVVSTSEILQRKVLRYFNAPHFDPVLNYASISSGSLPTRLTVLPGGFRRFAHKSALIERLADGKRSLHLFSCGGWGVDGKNQQRRLRQACLLNLDTGCAANCDLMDSAEKEDTSRSMERLYPSLTGVLDQRTFFLFGGRQSPEEALSSPVLIRFTEEIDSMRITPIFSKSDQTPSGRWRHASAGINSGGCAGPSDRVAISGGLATVDGEPLSDCWLFSITDHVWTRLPDLPIAVHSHSMCYDPWRNTLIILGGLQSAEIVSTKIQVYSFYTDQWTTVDAPAPFHVFGSTCFLISYSTVLSIGGASPVMGEFHQAAVVRILLAQSNQPPEIEFSTVYDLPDSSDFMLLNHQAVYDAMAKRVLMLGGGGNCFSFGTCFNGGLMEIDCTEFSQSKTSER